MPVHQSQLAAHELLILQNVLQAMPGPRFICLHLQTVAGCTLGP